MTSWKSFHKGHAKLAIEAIVKVIKADGEITKEEQRFASELENDLASNVGSFLKNQNFYLRIQSSNKNLGIPAKGQGKIHSGIF